jgi:hypothetical protein
VSRFSPSQALSVTSYTAFNRFDSVSSGPNSRRLRCSSFSVNASRRYFPKTFVGSPSSSPGAFTGTAYSAGSGSSRSRVSNPPFACGLDPIRSDGFGASSSNDATGRPSASNSSSGR